MSEKIVWTTEKRKVADLKDFSKNPRKFTDKGIKDLIASRYFGECHAK